MCCANIGEYMVLGPSHYYGYGMVCLPATILKRVPGICRGVATLLGTESKVRQQDIGINSCRQLVDLRPWWTVVVVAVSSLL